jgi:hypothetical protein
MKSKNKFKLIHSEKIPKSNKQVIIRTQEEINKYNQCIGYRKARMKRYGKSATSRLKQKIKT